MKILITGGCGFLAHHTSKYLLSKGHEVFALDNLSGGSLHNLAEGAHFIHCDVTDGKDLNYWVKHFKPHAVIHLAAMAAEILANHIMSHTVRENIIGTTNAIDACVNNRVDILHFASSIAVYGHQQPPFTEDTLPVPADAYGVSKNTGEQLVKIAKDFYGLNYVISRPHNIIGISQRLDDLFRNVVSIHIRQALAGKPLTIFGDGTQTRAFSSAEYVAQVIGESVLRYDTWNETYNVGGDTPYRVKDIAEIVCDAVGVPYNFDFQPPRVEAKHAHSNHEKVRKAFPDIKDTREIKDIIADMVEEARKMDIPEPKKCNFIEIEKNLPPAWK